MSEQQNLIKLRELLKKRTKSFEEIKTDVTELTEKLSDYIQKDYQIDPKGVKEKLRENFKSDFFHWILKGKKYKEFENCLPSRSVFSNFLSQKHEPKIVTRDLLSLFYGYAGWIGFCNNRSIKGFFDIDDAKEKKFFEDIILKIYPSDETIAFLKQFPVDSTDEINQTEKITKSSRRDNRAKVNSPSDTEIEKLKKSQSNLEEEIKKTQKDVSDLKILFEKSNAKHSENIERDIGLLSKKLERLRNQSESNFKVLEKKQKYLGKEFFIQHEKIQKELKKTTSYHNDLKAEISIKIEKAKNEVLEKQNLGFTEIERKNLEHKNELVQSISSLKSSVEDIHEKIVVSENRKDQISKVYVKGGIFTMGKKSWWDYEYKPHKVELDSFYISQYPITNQQFTEFLNEVKEIEGKPFFVKLTLNFSITKLNDRYYVKKGKENFPAVGITWFGANTYAKWIGGRLPTEAEWEFAARGGNKSRGYKFSGSNKTKHVANCSSFWKKITEQDTELLEIGAKLPNELEIYGMSGNIWEWCSDWHDVNYYETLKENQEITKNPLGPETGEKKILRGGSYLCMKIQCTVYHRDRFDPKYPFFTNKAIGFRVVFT